MFGVIVSYLVLLVILIAFAWLTVRAFRIKSLALKIPTLLVSGLLTVVLLALAFLAGKGLAAAFIPPVPVPAIVIEGTPEQIARGKYLANIACAACHGANGSGEFPLSGGFEFNNEIPAFAGKATAANITPGGVLAQRTDGELFRALRYGFGSKERLGMMSFIAIRELSDEDTKAIIAYLRSQDPVTTPTNGGDQMNLLGITMFYSGALIPLPVNNLGMISTPPQGVTAEYGRYLATLGDCRACHGPNMTGTAASPLGPAMPNPRPFVGKITLQEFVQTMRTGIRPNGIELQMPWRNAAKMNDNDLAALYKYLTTEP